RIRIAAQLVNAEDGYQLWSERYDRQMEDVFEIQDEISIAILRALRITLFTDQKKPQLRRYIDNVEAYQLYLRGRYYLTRLTREDWNKAIECFKQTLHLAPDFAPALTGFADAYFNLTSLYLSPQETMPKIREAATKALEIDHNIAEAHASLAMV